jgi:hypothetical protein
MDGDAAGAVAAYADLVADRIRVNGPDHRDTLFARYNLAVFRGKAGDATCAAVDLAELVLHQKRALGPDDPDTLASQRELARWRDHADPESAGTPQSQ